MTSNNWVSTWLFLTHEVGCTSKECEGNATLELNSVESSDALPLKWCHMLLKGDTPMVNGRFIHPSLKLHVAGFCLVKHFFQVFWDAQHQQPPVGDVWNPPHIQYWNCWNGLCFGFVTSPWTVQGFFCVTGRSLCNCRYKFHLGIVWSMI